MNAYILLAGAITMGICGFVFKKENEVWIAIALFWMAIASMK